MKNKSKQIFTACIATGLLSLGHLWAGVTFTESFENPTVSGYQQGTFPATGWVAANQGFGGNRHGLYNEDTGEFSTPYGEQSYRLNYTNSGLTTEEGIIGSLNSSTQYTISFNTALRTIDLANTVRYSVQLLALDSVPNGSRNDVRSIPAGGTLLASTSGLVISDDFSQSVNFVFNAGPSHPNEGQDLAIRLIKSSGIALYDNIIFNDAGVGSYVPEPTTTFSILLGASVIGFFRRLRLETAAQKSAKAFDA